MYLLLYLKIHVYVIEFLKKEKFSLQHPHHQHPTTQITHPPREKWKNPSTYVAYLF